ncbi:MAG: hypothetical protein K0R82_1413 [Flavipsychrobacter sp.]|nr:hypothetical protein [Flavipsychrobacter sp.]
MKPVLFFLALVIPCMAFAQSNNGLVAHWTFDGNAVDSSGNGHHGTMNNVTFAAGKSGTANTAMRFAGAPNSYVTVPYQSDLNLSNFSICAVIKPEGHYTAVCQHSLILTRGLNNTPGCYQLGFFDNAYDSSCTSFDTNKYVFFAAGGTTNYPYHAAWQSSAKVHTNQWYCLIGTFDGSVFKIYVNGVLVATAPPPSPVPLGSSTDGLTIGANTFGNSATFPYWYKGLMDDLRIYNRVLSDSELTTYCVPQGDGGGDTTNAVYDGLQQTINIGVVPNPNSGSFHVTGAIRAATADIEVVNMIGQRVYKTTVRPLNQNLDERIDLMDAAEGIYFVRVAAEGEIKTYRVLVQR